MTQVINMRRMKSIIMTRIMVNASRLCQNYDINIE